MPDRTERLANAFAALDRGDAEAFAVLLRPDAQWHGVEGMGHKGKTAT